MRAVDSKRLVIDTDVAQASGSEEATHPRAKHCRDFLQKMLSLGHSVVMTPEISNEWKRASIPLCTSVEGVNGCAQKSVSCQCPGI